MDNLDKSESEAVTAKIERWLSAFNAATLAAMLFPRLILILVVLVSASSAGWAAGDAARGEALARTWCANCHIVGGSTSGKDSAPPLPEVAKRGAPAQIQAKAFLSSPHPPMPNFNLAREQIDDIVAYLNTLAAQ